MLDSEGIPVLHKNAQVSTPKLLSALFRCLCLTKETNPPQVQRIVRDIQQKLAAILPTCAYVQYLKPRASRPPMILIVMLKFKTHHTIFEAGDNEQITSRSIDDHFPSQVDSWLSVSQL